MEINLSTIVDGCWTDVAKSRNQYRFHIRSPLPSFQLIKPMSGLKFSITISADRMDALERVPIIKWLHRGVRDRREGDGVGLLWVDKTFIIYPDKEGDSIAANDRLFHLSMLTMLLNCYSYLIATTCLARPYTYIQHLMYSPNC